MDKKQKVSNIVRFSISLALVLLCFFTLFFFIWQIKVSSSSESITASENGFSFLGFDSALLDIGENYKSFVSLVAILVYMQILFSVIYLFYLLASITKILNSNEKNSSIPFTFNLLCIMFSLMYMVIGFVSKNIIIKNLEESGGAGIGSIASSIVKTQAFIPVILNMVLLILFFVCPAILESNFTLKNIDTSNSTVSNSTEDVTNNVEPLKKVQSLTDVEKIALLSKYHELVQNSILSQEDFERKKKEILGL